MNFLGKNWVEPKLSVRVYIETHPMEPTSKRWSWCPAEPSRGGGQCPILSFLIYIIPFCFVAITRYFHCVYNRVPHLSLSFSYMHQTKITLRHVILCFIMFCINSLDYISKVFYSKERYCRCNHGHGPLCTCCHGSRLQALVWSYLRVTDSSKLQNKS